MYYIHTYPHLDGHYSLREGVAIIVIFEGEVGDSGKFYVTHIHELDSDGVWSCKVFRNTIISPYGRTFHKSLTEAKHEALKLTKASLADAKEDLKIFQASIDNAEKRINEILELQQELNPEIFI